MSCSRADRQSAQMEIPFCFTTERLTPAWPWLPAASALSSRGSTHTAVQQVHSRSNGNANSVLAQGYLGSSGYAASVHSVPRFSSAQRSQLHSIGHCAYSQCGEYVVSIVGEPKAAQREYSRKRQRIRLRPVSPRMERLKIQNLSRSHVDSTICATAR